MANAAADDGVEVQQPLQSIFPNPAESGGNKRPLGSGFQRLPLSFLQASVLVSKLPWGLIEPANAGFVKTAGLAKAQLSRYIFKASW